MFTYVFVIPSILQSQFSEKGFKKTKNFKHSGVLLLFLFTLENEISKDRFIEQKKKTRKKRARTDQILSSILQLLHKSRLLHVPQVCLTFTILRFIGGRNVGAVVTK